MAFEKIKVDREEYGCLYAIMLFTKNILKNPSELRSRELLEEAIKDYDLVRLNNNK